jgi:hypothetical protein
MSRLMPLIDVAMLIHLGWGILKRNAIKGSRYLLLMGAENLPETRR